MKDFSQHELDIIKSALESMIMKAPGTAECQTIDNNKVVLTSEIHDVYEKIECLNSKKLQTQLQDVSCSNNGHSNPILATVEIEHNDPDCMLVLKAKGYSDTSSEDDSGTVMLVENNDGIMQIRVWADINKEVPTHVISFSEARNEARNEED